MLTGVPGMDDALCALEYLLELFADTRTRVICVTGKLFSLGCYNSGKETLFSWFVWNSDMIFEYYLK